MKIELLHYEVNRKWQSHNNYRAGLSDNQLDLTLRDAISYYFEHLAFGNDPRGTKLGAEDSIQRSEMLSTLLKTSSISAGAAQSDGLYPFPIPSNYGSYRESTVATNCGKFDVHLKPHDDMNEVLRSYNQKPSKKFKRAIAFLRSGNLYVYLPTGVTPTLLNLFYYKKPNEVCLGTYPDIPNVGSGPGANMPKVECDLPEKYHYLVVDIAVAELNRIYGDVTRLNISTEKILSQ